MNSLNEKSFREGFEGGLEGVPLEPINNKLTDSAAVTWLRDKLDMALNRLKVLDAEVADSLERKRHVFLEFTKTDQQLEQLIAERHAAASLIQNEKAKLESLATQKETEKSPYSLLAGILYFLAGFAFLAGDLIISHEIVAYALNIRNTVEAWAFAVGLASLSILLKPAYERLVEQPYLAGKGKRVYAYFQSGLLVLCVLTLTVLGWFRYEAYKTDKLKAGINQEIKSLELAAEGAENPILLEQIDSKLKAYTELNTQLVNSPLAMFSFILTGLLFALAGAVCLGIAFPILQVYWKRAWVWNKAMSKSRRLIFRNEKMLKQTAEKYYALQASRSILSEELTVFRTVEEIKTERAKLLNDMEEWEQQYFSKLEGAVTENVLDGFSRGEQVREILSEDELRNHYKRYLEKKRIHTEKPLHVRLREVAAQSF